MELSKQETDLFFHFQASDQKSSFTKCFSFIPRGSRLIFQTGNVIQTRNGIIHPTSWLLMKKNSFTKFYSIDLSGPTLIFKTGYMELSKQEMKFFPCLWSKNFFYNMLLNWSNGFKVDFQNRNWNYPNMIWNHFSHLKASD